MAFHPMKARYFDASPCRGTSERSSLFWFSRRTLSILQECGHEDALHDQNGQALVETALTFTVLMTFFLAFMEICLIFYSYCMIAESAREGTRYASLHGSTCVTASQATCTASASSVNTYISSISWPNLGGGTLSGATTFPDGNEAPGSRVKITVSYIFPITVPFLPAQSVSMASTSESYILQ